MRNFWLIARQEYLVRVRQRSFLLATVGILLVIAAIVVISVFVSIGGRDSRPVGYVDVGNVLAGQATAAAAVDDWPVFVAFADEASAQRALASGEIAAFYVLPAEYLSKHEVTVYYDRDAPNVRAREAFDDFVRRGLVAGQPADLQPRLLESPTLLLRSLDGGRELDAGDIVGILLPFAAGLLFIMSTMTSSGYLIQALTAEKENRTSEVMMTTVTPFQLVGGKAVGLMSVSLSQIAIWLVVAVIALLVAGRWVPELRGLKVPPGLVLFVLLYFLPSYALVAGLMTAVGAIMPDAQEGQQVSGILSLLFFIPYILSVPLITDPNGPLAVGLSLFPTTAFTTLSTRWGFTAIPFWQLAASWLILVGSAALSVALAAAIFRVGMLRYGQRLDLATIRAALSRGFALRSPAADGRSKRGI